MILNDRNYSLRQFARVGRVYPKTIGNESVNKTKNNDQEGSTILFEVIK